MSKVPTLDTKLSSSPLQSIQKVKPLLCVQQEGMLTVSSNPTPPPPCHSLTTITKHGRPVKLWILAHGEGRVRDAARKGKSAFEEQLHRACPY